MSPRILLTCRYPQGAFVGRLFDAYGPRPIMVIGSLVLVLGTMLTSISTHYYQYILAQGVLVGVGIGTVYVPHLCVFCSLS